MSKRAERAASAAYPFVKREFVHPYGVTGFDGNHDKREVFQEGYEHGEKDTIERACQLLYDYNKQMTEMFGEKAVLSCSQFTIDVERFRKTLIIEEESKI